MAQVNTPVLANPVAHSTRQLALALPHHFVGVPTDSEIAQMNEIGQRIRKQAAVADTAVQGQQLKDAHGEWSRFVHNAQSLGAPGYPAQLLQSIQDLRDEFVELKAGMAQAKVLRYNEVRRPQGLPLLRVPNLRNQLLPVGNPDLRSETAIYNLQHDALDAIIAHYDTGNPQINPIDNTLKAKRAAIVAFLTSA
ncbi:uncharacterized protein JCM10292_002079 [Rhodotorula paludigena]|uniref:uncharacterized protein n=1 Tax=Rhodotorula paludigena TaxID=86838 RepID=UPI00317BCDD2